MHKITRGLWIAIGLSVLVALLLFFWVGERQGRVPYLNVNVLPTEESMARVEHEAILARPLFWEARRPVFPPEPVVVETPDEPEVVEPLDGVRLLGIIATEESHLVLLEVDGKVQRLQGGDRVKQWEVSAITARGVEFSSRGRKFALTLERETHQSIKLER